jgi:predicted aconitase
MTGRILLDAREDSLLAGAEGLAMQLAMYLLRAPISWARSARPDRLCHLDACFYTGQSHVDFAQYLLTHGARFCVPAWTNAGMVSLLMPACGRTRPGDGQGLGVS